jgi:hypothetical protein
MDPDQPAHPFLYLLQGLQANSMDPDQTVQMRKLVWIHAGRKRTMLVLCRDMAHIDFTTAVNFFLLFRW